MARIYVLMGKSATGKDTIYKKILDSGKVELKEVVTYTTRPIISAFVSADLTRLISRMQLSSKSVAYGV